MHAQRIKTGLRRLGDVALNNIYWGDHDGPRHLAPRAELLGGSQIGCGGRILRKASRVCLYRLTRLLVWTIPDSAADVDKNSN
jgi:hypothetical protein